MYVAMCYCEYLIRPEQIIPERGPLRHGAQMGAISKISLKPAPTVVLCYGHLFFWIKS